MIKNLKSVITLFIVLLTLSSCTNNKSTEFSFAFLTDIHIQPELQAGARFEKCINSVNTLNPDFVITGGDLIMDALGQSQERAEQLYQLYLDKSAIFQMPVYNTLGNHENFGLYKKSGIQPENPMFGKEMFKNKLGDGKTYFSFDHKGWHFIILDAVGFTNDREYYGYIDSLQIDWLRQDLMQTGKQKPIVVSLHIPLTSVYQQMKNGATSALSNGAVVTNSVDVIKCFDGYNLKLVLQGHLHVVEEIVYNDVHYITGGAVCGAWWKGARDGFPPGYVMVNIKDEDFTWSYETFGDQPVKE